MTFQIWNGECLEIMDDYINHCGGQLFDAIIVDIPYGTTANKWDEVIPFPDMWERLEQLIKPKGNIVLFGSGLFGMRLCLSNIKKFRYELIWKKSKCGSPLTAKYMPLKKHENIYVFGESASYYEPQMTEGTPYKRKYTPNKTNNMRYGIAGVETDNKGTRHPITVLDYPQKWRRQDQVHPTQKPVELMEFLVKSYCPPGGRVLDFTMGSGTTGVACMNTGRNFIGIEINEDYYNIAEDRISKAYREHKKDYEEQEQKQETHGVLGLEISAP